MNVLERRLIGLYLITVAAFLVASWLPDQRLWAFNLWGYLPMWFRWLAAGFALVPPAIWFVLVQKKSDMSDNTPGSLRSFAVMSILIGMVMAALYIIYHLRTYFLGDGYMVLSILSEEHPLLKLREVGEVFSHIWVKNMIGEGRPAALLSYQTISVGAGILYAAGASLFASKLFSRNVDRVLFLLGALSGGYVLLFFGYVENYSLFVVMVSVYVGLGLLVHQRGINPLWALAGSIGCTLFHIMGITTLPSAIYLVLRNTLLGRWFKGTAFSTKTLVLILLCAVIGAVITFFYQTSQFFRFALVPFQQNRFTLDGYTLFSASHLIDMLNLLFILCPGIVVLVAALWSVGFRRLFRLPPTRFLLILTVSALGAAFIFDPKLGMSRDWDLFSFAGIASVLGGVYFLLSSKLPDRSKALVILLMVSLGAVSVGSRIVIHNDDATAVARFLYFCDLDHTKGRPAEGILVDYYVATDRTEEAKLTKQRWSDHYPQNRMVQEGRDLVNRGMTSEGIAKLRRVLEIEPTYYGAWANLVRAYNALGQYRQALEHGKIAAGLNPWESRNFNNLGISCFHLGMYQESERYYETALSHTQDSTFVLKNLLALHRETEQTEKYMKTAHLLVNGGNAPTNLIQMLANNHLKNLQYDSAAVLYEMALKKGLDTHVVLDVLQRYPKLKVRGIQP